MVTATNLGFPRIGKFRELKKAVESFWKGNMPEAELQNEAKAIRKANWELQKNAGIEHIPSNDFSFYDQVLDMTATLGAVPSRYKFSGGNVDLDTYFAMARGKQQGGVDVVAMEMTKWFDTNYHFIVPEIESDTNFSLSSSKIFDEYKEAKALGIQTRPVILGPVTYLSLAKSHKDERFDPLSKLEELLPVYEEILQKLEAEGAEWIQIDEPILALDLEPNQQAAFATAYDTLAASSELKILVATYFDRLGDNTKIAAELPVEALHIDLKRAPEQLNDVIDALPAGKILSLGVIDGRNIWKANLSEALDVVHAAVDKLGSDRVFVAPSCSLLHTPVDLASEEKLDDELKNWLAFAAQKLNEIKLITDAANGNQDEAAFKANADAIASRANSSRIHNADVKARYASISEDMLNRKSKFEERIEKQEAHLKLPLLPTTTIGSFPQTQEIRQARAKHKKGELSDSEYNQFLKDKTLELIRAQEEMDIDVLVHGEYERNDMVEYFGEQLSGYAFSQYGWVQSYGSRCVKPPIIFGDVSRNGPMTVEWSKFAQDNTDRVMKGMLTGPVTMLQWAFVRDDQPRDVTCKQIALAIRDEVSDLEAAGIHVIQIDEPAFREGLPLKLADRPAYLKWAVESFRISSSAIEDTTQIHTHMCYSEFNDIIDSIADLDADVISIETSRSAMELLDAFVEFKYPNEIGPGVYDIHSPRIPQAKEMEKLLYKALDVLKPEQVWVNPDCGLKTRGWDEVKPALEEMVAAAKSVRSELKEQQAA